MYVCMYVCMWEHHGDEYIYELFCCYCIAASPGRKDTATIETPSAAVGDRKSLGPERTSNYN